MEIRIREAGAVVTEQEFRAMHSRNVSFTETITADQIDGLGADPVLESPAPSVTATQTAYRNGVALVEKNGRSWYEQAWAVRDLTPEEIESRKPPVPQIVTMRQARLALLQAGLLTTVNDAIAAMTGAQGEAARIEWEYSQEVHRGRSLVAAMAQILELTDAQVDALFVTAATL